MAIQTPPNPTPCPDCAIGPATTAAATASVEKLLLEKLWDSARACASLRGATQPGLSGRHPPCSPEALGR